MKKQLALLGILAVLMGGLLVSSAEARSNCNDRHDRGHHYGWYKQNHRMSANDRWRDHRIAMLHDRHDRRSDRFNDRFERRDGRWDDRGYDRHHGW